MRLTDEIRDYQVTAALPSEIIKTAREYEALAVLKFSFPDFFSDLHKDEAPDLQDPGGVLGVEVTWGGSPNDEKINGESKRYYHAKTNAEREKALKKIRENGGDIDEYSISFPPSNANKDMNYVSNVFRKKLTKVNIYRQRFQYIGLAILMDIPMFFLTDLDWKKWITDMNDGNFDFVAFIHWSGVDLYDFRAEKHILCRIDRNDMDALRKLARMTTEGIIKDDDPVWD